jgi:Gpi18-like mannosyltransferase
MSIERDRFPPASGFRSDAVRLVLVISAVCAVGCRVWLSTIDLETLLNYVPDDSFYYFQLASNLISGKSSSIDGIHLTNGYHPLWVWVIAPFFTLKTLDPTLPVRIALLFSSLLSIATAYFIYLIVKEATGNRWFGVFGFAFYVFNPQILYSEAMGEPSALSNLLLAASLFAIYGLSGKRWLSWSKSLSLGVLFGLAFLARTDNALFIVVFIVAAAAWSRPFDIKKITTITAVTIIVVLPWFIWNLVNFGTIVQVSAVANAYVLNANSNAAVLPGGFRYYGLSNVWAFSRHIFGYSLISYFFPFLVISLVGGYFLTMTANKRIITCLLLMSAVIGIMYFLHVEVAGVIRPWHMTSAAPVTALVISLAAYIYSFREKFRPPVLVGVTALFAFLIGVNVNSFLSHPKYPWQLDAFDAAVWVKGRPDEKAAVYDGGIVNYYADGKLLPIDGNVNNEAFEAIKDRRLYEYMKENDADYLVGWAWILKKYEKFWPYPTSEIFEEVEGVRPREIENRPIGEFKYYKLK